MEEILLLTVKLAAQADDGLLIGPFLPIDNCEFDLDWINKIRIVKPDNQILEKDAELGIPLDI